MYDVVRLHQVIVYGKNGKIARELKKKYGYNDIPTQILEAEEKQMLANDWFDHRAYDKDVY